MDIHQNVNTIKLCSYNLRTNTVSKIVIISDVTCTKTIKMTIKTRQRVYFDSHLKSGRF